MSWAGFEPAIARIKGIQNYALGDGYTGARNDTTQQSGQTPDKEVEIKNITVYTEWHKKNGHFWKTQQKLKKSKKKYLLTEIEPLQLAF